MIGMVAIPFPQILGNGKGLALLGFDGRLAVGAAATLLLLKTLATVTSLGAGAEGGLLTPSVAIGASLATVMSGIWNWAWPGGSPGATAIIGRDGLPGVLDANAADCDCAHDGVYSRRSRFSYSHGVCRRGLDFRFSTDRCPGVIGTDACDRKIDRVTLRVGRRPIDDGFLTL